MPEHPAKSVFVAMPFAERFDELYRGAIVEAAASAALKINKLGRLPIVDIIPQMQSQIGQSDLLVAVATDRNPHVFFEIGLAHAQGKSCIILGERESDFEIFQYLHRCLTYDRDIAALRDRLKQEFIRLTKP